MLGWFLNKKVFWFLVLLFCAGTAALGAQTKGEPKEYASLVSLFYDWRDFEKPPLLNGAPNYTKKSFKKRDSGFRELRSRLEKINTSSWEKSYLIDFKIVWAEMNGYDFNRRVLKPWERDPAFYQTIWTYESDVPAHEGPTNHAVLELWTYSFPLTEKEEERLTKELQVIPPLLKQARKNLTGNAKDLWVAGVVNLERQGQVLRELQKKIIYKTPELESALKKAEKETSRFVVWLKKEAKNKTGPSGVGKENYTWYQQNVHLLPFTWEEEVALLERELSRAWSSLALEEQKNRGLPPMTAASSPEEFNKMAEEGVKRLMSFLKEKEVMPIKKNMEPALRKHMGRFVKEEDRNFFLIGMHYDPVPLYSHFYHWFDLAEIRDNPHKSPIRKGPLLYNIFDSKSEGIATGV